MTNYNLSVLLSCYHDESENKTNGGTNSETTKEGDHNGINENQMEKVDVKTGSFDRIPNEIISMIVKTAFSIMSV